MNLVNLTGHPFRIQVAGDSGSVLKYPSVREAYLDSATRRAGELEVKQNGEKYLLRVHGFANNNTPVELPDSSPGTVFVLPEKVFVRCSDRADVFMLGPGLDRDHPDGPLVKVLIAH